MKYYGSEGGGSYLVKGGGERAAQAGVDVVGAPLWFVGVGGFTLGGGYGPLSGEYGLAIDNLLSATVVLADGRVVKTSAEEDFDMQAFLARILPKRLR